MLHALGHLYGLYGHTKRALALQLLAARLAPDDAGVLRTLAHTFLIDGSPEGALRIIDRLQSMNETEGPAVELLRSRALWASGRHAEARALFRDFLQLRGQS